MIFEDIFIYKNRGNLTVLKVKFSSLPELPAINEYNMWRLHLNAR